MRKFHLKAMLLLDHVNLACQVVHLLWGWHNFFLGAHVRFHKQPQTLPWLTKPILRHAAQLCWNQKQRSYQVFLAPIHPYGNDRSLFRLFR